MAMRFDILSIFPEMFSSLAGVSILRRAMNAGKIEIILHDIRQYAKDKRRSVDDAPYGGGAGMVMKPEPILNAMAGVEETGGSRVRILLSPQGEKLTQKLAGELASHGQLILVCGHYEGVDQRVIDSVIDREISVGDYVVTGGELPAMIVVDAVSRLIEGVLGNELSRACESFENSLLEYPQYTRPAVFDGRKVPDVLLAGDHKRIAEWRERESRIVTKRNRPDLICEPYSPPLSIRGG